VKEQSLENAMAWCYIRGGVAGECSVVVGEERHRNWTRGRRLLNYMFEKRWLMCVWSVDKI